MFCPTDVVPSQPAKRQRRGVTTAVGVDGGATAIGRARQTGRHRVVVRLSCSMFLSVSVIEAGKKDWAPVADSQAAVRVSGNGVGAAVGLNAVSQLRGTAAAQSPQVALNRISRTATMLRIDETREHRVLRVWFGRQEAEVTGEGLVLHQVNAADLGIQEKCER